jgi:predicted glutamine amidotransferase
VHDSGWGMAVYRNVDGMEPTLVRFPEAAYAGDEFERSTTLRGRIFNVHVRRATLGGLTPENTHPFLLGNYSFAHNGTVIAYPRLLEPGVARPAGETDSEAIFNYLMRYFDPGDVPGSLRRAMSAVVARSAFSGLNFLFSDGERLFAYRFGIFDLHWLARPGRLLVSSERITDEAWHTVQQDVLLTLDPAALDEPHAERLLGDELARRAEIDRLEEQTHLRGAARGAFAAERAARVAAAMAE